MIELFERVAVKIIKKNTDIGIWENISGSVANVDTEADSSGMHLDTNDYHGAKDGSYKVEC